MVRKHAMKSPEVAVAGSLFPRAQKYYVSYKAQVDWYRPRSHLSTPAVANTYPTPSIVKRQICQVLRSLDSIPRRPTLLPYGLLQISIHFSVEKLLGLYDGLANVPGQCADSP
jgi:hypothetical protein